MFLREGRRAAGENPLLEPSTWSPIIPWCCSRPRLQPWKRPADVGVMEWYQLEPHGNIVYRPDGPIRPDREELASRRPWMRDARPS